MLKVYGADEVSVVFAGILLEAENDDEFVTISKISDNFFLREGVNGHSTRSRRRGTGYTVTVNLPQTSDKNILLSALHNLDILPDSNGAGVAPMAVVDTGGTTAFSGPEGWIVKMPDWKAAAEADAVAWQFIVVGGVFNLGGN